MIGGTGGAGPASAVGLWAVREARRRWRSLVVLGVLAGLTGGLCLAALAGARRTSTAYARWRAATAAPDALVFGTQVGLHNVDYSPVRKLPEVVAAGTFSLSPLAVRGNDQMGSLPPGDDQLYRTVSRPLLAHGRLPDPHRADEILVNRAAASKYHLHLGQHLTVISATDQAAFYGQAPMTGGPTVRATIVGIGDSMIDLIFQPNQPGFTPSAAFLANAPQVPRAPNLVVRLRPGTDVARFHQLAAAALHLPDIPVRDLGQDRKRFVHATDLERTGLLLFAAAVALAGIVLVGQALTRLVYAIADASGTLRALGLTRANLLVGLALPFALTGVTSVVVAIASAVALSGRFPVGLSRRLDPDVGLHADWLVLAPGAVVVVVLVLLASAYAGWRATRSRAGAAPEESPSAALRAVRAAAPPSTAIGVGFALGAGRGERAVPVRPAIAGAVAGILGVVGALGLVHGIDDALGTPGRAGQVWDAQVWPDSPPLPASLISRVEREPEVANVARARLTPLDVDGAGLPVYSLRAVRGQITFTVLRGRAPEQPDEAALGPATSKALHKRIGDVVRLSAADAQATVRVVGIALVPQTPHSSFDQGVWALPATTERLVRTTSDGPDETLFVTARTRVNTTAFADRLHRRLGVEVDQVQVPQDVELLRNVRALPQALSLFLALLGLAALLHALVSVVRRRRHDLAVLRALGFGPRQNAAVIFWQAVTVAVVGAVLGIPLGIAVGRVSWRWVADATPLRYVPPIAAIAVLLALPASLALANLLAVLPARRAAGLNPSTVLRTE